jgi:hypothetical protein
MKPFGRPGDAASANDGIKNPKVSEIHTSLLEKDMILFIHLTRLGTFCKVCSCINVQGDAAMKVPQTCAGGKTHAVWAGTIKLLIHRYLEHRNKRRALRRGSAENKIVSPYEGRRWCDATERELIGDITNIHSSHL